MAMSSIDPQPASEPLILTSREGAIARITLNRPRAINALNIEMFEGLHEALRAAESSQPSPTVIYLDGAGDRGFCGGGDIKEIASGGSPHTVFGLEYTLNHAIHVSQVPVVAIMDGVTMGGGIGLGGHAALRIVTERSRLAMPEARIGIIPDVGGSLLLANAPGRLGEYLTITAGEMNATDAIDLGFADTCISSERIAELCAALAGGGDPRSTIETFAMAPADRPAATLAGVREWFDPIADAALGERGSRDAIVDPAAVTARLIAALEASDRPEVQTTASTVREMNPESVALALSQLARVRAEQLGLAEVLDDDYRIMTRLALLPNFTEGVRALLIDKDRNPKWAPARIEDLDPASLASVLRPYDADERSLWA